ncbi:hypothetical protein GCM10009718_29330 [Isoptericola halotolerans]|uniref:Uncharacterized protein n=1 Tax=Isoptericola halotolerans TaxID=300560 RepID=A0ABX2A7Z1_9MICO|nr:hypothetical protein [Isoptericola halotolerans]NOV97726.1 hypothetical protein [Isoptericola halotolerans]
MLQRILGAVLVVAGLAAIAFGVATATVLRESDTVVATARPVGDGTVVVTDPGVLDLVDADVTVTASVPAGQEVTVVVGRDVDVLGWLEGDPYARVTGLADWETLTTSAVTPEEAEDPEAEPAEGDAEEPQDVELPDPAGSDMWITELTAAEQVSLRWNDRPGPWVLLAAGTGAAPADEADEEAEEEGTEASDADAQTEASDADAVAPTLELTWEREVSTPLLWPAVGLGGLLLLLGIVLVVVGGRRKKRSRRGSAAPAAGAAAAAAGAPSALSGDSPIAPDSPLSPDSPASPASPLGSAGGASPWAAPGAEQARPTPVEEPGGAWEPATATRPDPVAPEDEGSGTAPVPVAGRFSRRSRLRPTRSAPEVPLHDEGGSPDVVEEHQDDAPATTTGSMPALADGRPLTRRELRRREEERRAGAQSGMSRAFRALTGQTPVVPPADAAPPEVADPPAAPGRRAAAWRETWGFDATSTAQDASQDETTEGGTR